MRPLQNEGSALLVALIVMGILLTLSLGVSNLLIGALRDSRLLLEKTRAWYAAETGMEHALYAASKNPPGFEEEKSERLGGLGDSEYAYAIRATAKEIPPKESYEIRSESDRFASLRLNESVTIPLFRGSGAKPENASPTPESSVKNFRVDYYLAPDLKLQGARVDDDLDILRWKIFGIARDGKMEVINEFVPADKGNSAESPTCLGTGSNCYNAAKFYQRRLAPDGATEFHIVEEFPISTFLNEHTQNFLVLTNIVNIELISADTLSTAEKMSIANIRYRVVEEDGNPNLTLPSIHISSDGFSGAVKQSLNLEVKRDSFLPVFNYALYRTAD